MATLSNLLTLKTKTTVEFSTNCKCELAKFKDMVVKNGNRSKVTRNKGDYDEWTLTIYVNVKQALATYQEVDLAYNFCDLPEFEEFTVEEIEEHLRSL